MIHPILCPSNRGNLKLKKAKRTERRSNSTDFTDKKFLLSGFPIPCFFFPSVKSVKSVVHYLWLRRAAMRLLMDF
jgi:hypothetical protein